MKQILLFLPLALILSCQSPQNPELTIIAGENDTTIFFQPFGMCSDPQGNLYVADAAHNQIKIISTSGEVSVFAGTGEAGNMDAPAEQASFNYPSGICVDAEGNFFVAGFGGQNIRKISADGIVSTIAGTGEEGYRDGEASQSVFSSPRGVCIDSKGNLYVGDCWNHRIRKISPDGMVTTFAGGGKRGELVTGDWRDGQDTTARFDAPCGMAIDNKDNIYVADAINNCIRKITPDGYVTTLAGIAGEAGSIDGPYGESILNCPTELHIVDNGIIYFSDTYGNQIRMIDRDSNVSTLIGTGEDGRLNQDALSSTLGSPRGITIYDKHLIFIEYSNRMIRKYGPM